MNPPEYDAPHYTETQRLAHDITTAMHNLQRDWPHMHRPGDTQTPGRHTTAGAHLDDHDTNDTDTNRITRTISLRRAAQDTLAAWAELIIEERPITNATTTPLRTDTPALAAFIATHADWLSGHDAANDARDELRQLAHRCHLTAYPPVRDSMSIGRCPIEIPGEHDVLETCGGDVRSRPSESDGRSWLACNRCGETAVADWWENRMFDDAETQRWLTDAGVVTLVHRLYGELIKQGTVRQWVKRGVLVASTETNEDGRRLFTRESVVLAMEVHKGGKLVAT